MNADLDQRLQRAATDFDNAVNEMAMPHARIATASDARAPNPGGWRRMALAAIGVAATVGVLAAIVANRPEPSSVVPADTVESPQPIDTQPSMGPDVPIETSPQAIDTVESPQPIDTTFPTESSPPTDTAASAETTMPTVIAPNLVVVDESTLRTAALQRTVLYTAGSGSAVDELGQEQCTECDGASPSNPLIDDDGTIVIDDPVNRRVVVVSGGTPIAAPYPEHTIAHAQGVLADHLVYLPMRIGNPSVAPTASEIHVLRVADLKAGQYTIVDRYDIGAMIVSSISIRNGELFANDTAVRRLTELPLGTPQISRGSDPNEPEVIVSFSGRQMTWQFPAGWWIGEMVPIADGSVAAVGSSQSGRALGLQLLPTGEAIVGDVNDNVSDSGTAQVTPAGIVQLESGERPFEVVRYALPANNATMHISNQSFDDPTVGITVSIDGVEVIDGDFEVGNQHNWITHELSLAPGRHTVMLTSSTGATESITIDTTWEAHQWMVANYWSDSGTPPKFTFESFDEPVAFD